MLLQARYQKPNWQKGHSRNNAYRKAGIYHPGTYIFPKITLAQIKSGANKIPMGKAPEPDGVPGFIIKEIASKKSEIMQKVFNLCLGHCFFQKKWKATKLVLLRKGTKPLELQSEGLYICYMAAIIL